MGRRRRHHVVSRGFQRGFAIGDRLRVVDKQTSTWFEAGTRDLFVSQGFNSWMGPAGPSDELEAEWARIEATTLTAPRRIGSPVERPGDRNAAKVVAAVHFARSYAMRDAHLRIAYETAKAEGTRFEADPRARVLFETDYGRAPLPGELEDHVMRSMDRMVAHRGPFASTMVRSYNFALRFFAEKHVQVFTAPGEFGFVLGDCPVLLANKELTRLSTKGQLALGDSELFYMPISTRAAITLWSGAPDPDVTLPVVDCQRLNHLSWRAALQYVACNPDHDPARLLAMRIKPRSAVTQDAY